VPLIGKHGWSDETRTAGPPRSRRR
jgi:hypothetical protein